MHLQDSEYYLHDSHIQLTELIAFRKMHTRTEFTKKEMG